MISTKAMVTLSMLLRSSPDETGIVNGHGCRAGDIGLNVRVLALQGGHVRSYRRDVVL